MFSYIRRKGLQYFIIIFCHIFYLLKKTYSFCYLDKLCSTITYCSIATDVDDEPHAPAAKLTAYNITMQAS